MNSEHCPKRERILIRDGQVVTMPRPEDRVDAIAASPNRPDPNVYDSAGHAIGFYL